MPVKTCPRCGETKDVESGFGTRSQGGKTYPRSLCRLCQRARNRERYEPGVAAPRPAETEGEKFCKPCGRTLPLASFGKNRRNKDGRSTYCRECAAAATRKRKAAMTPEQLAAYRKKQGESALQHGWKRRHNLRRFGLTEADWQAMVDAQGGLCAICGNPESALRGGRVLTMSVDHDHECCPGDKTCGKCVRAMLCGNCNKGLGCFGDDPALLLKAAAYIESYRVGTITNSSENPREPIRSMGPPA